MLETLRHRGVFGGGGDSPVFIPIHVTRHDVMDVCARADEEENNEEEGLEVEERGLGSISPL